MVTTSITIHSDQVARDSETCVLQSAPGSITTITGLEPARPADHVTVPLASRRVQCALGQDQHSHSHPPPPPTPSSSTIHPDCPEISGVTGLVEVTLLGDLVRVLRKTEAHHSALAEQKILANAHRAALVEAQREAAAHQAGILTHQRAVAASAIRSEMRAYNCVASRWQALPLFNGDPFPVEQTEFPANLRALRTMPDDQVRRVAALYGIGDGSDHVDDLRDDIRCFVTGRRS